MVNITDTTVVPRYYGHDCHLRSTDAQRSQDGDTPTKLLPLTSQTKLTLTLTLPLPLTLLNHIICAQIVHTHNKVFLEFIKGIFARALAGFVGGANYCTTSRNFNVGLFSCTQHMPATKKIGLKEGFLWAYV